LRNSRDLVRGTEDLIRKTANPERPKKRAMPPETVRKLPKAFERVGFGLMSATEKRPARFELSNAASIALERASSVRKERPSL